VTENTHPSSRDDNRFRLAKFNESISHGKEIVIDLGTFDVSIEYNLKAVMI
jgi:hypothetical protein